MTGSGFNNIVNQFPRINAFSRAGADTITLTARLVSTRSLVKSRQVPWLAMAMASSLTDSSRLSPLAMVVLILPGSTIQTEMIVLMQHQQATS